MTYLGFGLMAFLALTLIRKHDGRSLGFLLASGLSGALRWAAAAIPATAAACASGLDGLVSEFKREWRAEYHRQRDREVWISETSVR